MALLTMPKLGLTMEEARVSEWKVAPESRFAKGDVIVIVETDKIASEIEAPSAGHIVEFIAMEGDVVSVGNPIANWVPDGEQPFSPERLAPAESKVVGPQSPSSEPYLTSRAGASKSESRIIATPLARRVARELGIGLQTVTGSGPRGRIKEKDVRAKTIRIVEAPQPTAARQQPETPSATVAPSAWQRVTAQAMVRSKTTIPHFYLSTEIDVAPIDEVVAKLRTTAGERRITATSVFLFAIGRALVSLPNANRVWVEDGLRPIGPANVGLAIATPNGLAAPIIQDCAGPTIWDIADQVDATIDRARKDRLTAIDLETPAAITLSNAGMHDITQMISIIPPAQSAILGIGSVRSTFRPDTAGQAKPVREIVLSLSCDHRVFDGVSGLGLLDAIRRTLGDPLKALLAPAERTR